MTDLQPGKWKALVDEVDPDKQGSFSAGGRWKTDKHGTTFELFVHVTGEAQSWLHSFFYDLRKRLKHIRQFFSGD